MNLIDTSRPAAPIPPTPLPPLPPRFRPLFSADWVEAAFVHYAIDPRILQPHVPLPLDLYEGKAYVSLVAFTQKNLRPRYGGRLAAAGSAPLATHGFLNLRTYVRVGDERAILFLAEWIPNVLARALGPMLYGLPFRLARLDYRDALCRHVCAHGRAFRCRLQLPQPANFTAAPPAGDGGLDAFLLERYAAFTCRHGKLRMFRIAHEPWPQTPAAVCVEDDRLITATADWFGDAQLVGANYSPGVRKVWIGPPRTQGGVRFRPGRIGWVPLLLLTLLALRLRSSLPAWLFMWAIGFAMFLGCKWLTWWKASAAYSEMSVIRSLGYLLAWPGMDARRFLDRAARPADPRPKEWWAAGTKIAVGAILFWSVARWAATSPLLAGWIGMVGMILMLHFGLFHLLSLFWRTAGVAAEPIMDCPARSRSLSEFWGKRWNRGFHRLVNDLVFRPLCPKLGPVATMLTVFLVSGLIHEAVISLPARGGWGLPTAYFLLQGIGLLLERNLRIRTLQRHWVGRVLTIAWVALPALGLFHPAFVRRVMVPLLHMARAL